MKEASALGKVGMLGVERDGATAARWLRIWRSAGPGRGSCGGDAAQLRLILGVGRSGTTWLSRGLASTSTPIRFVEEGFFWIEPKLEFAAEGDHTAIAYRPALPEQHPLVCVYRALGDRGVDWSQRGLARHVRRDDADWRICLVKEVHSLLATEGLLNALKCPTLLVVRDPVYVVDSVFDRFGMESIFLGNEARWVREPAFLERIAGVAMGRLLDVWQRVDEIADGRARGILEKVLTVASIGRMFRLLASECGHAKLVEYEALCRSPEAMFRSAAEFLDLAWCERIEKYLEATTDSASETDDPRSVVRVTARQVGRPLRFLSADEASACRRVLAECGLGDEPDPGGRVEAAEPVVLHRVQGA